MLDVKSDMLMAIKNPVQKTGFLLNIGSVIFLHGLFLHDNFA